MPFSEAIASRAVGQYPLSVATSLAIESACGVHPEVFHDHPPVNDYPELWINLRTLFRNFIGALDKDAARGVQPQVIAETLQVEMDIITEIIAAQTQSRTRLVFYVSNYAGIETKYIHAVVRRDNTDKQKEYTAIQNQSIERLLDILKSHNHDVRVFDLKLKTQNTPVALIMTHYAYDLVAYREFSKLVLLESHTGALKERAQWYTKYYQGKDLAMIPFREDFIQIFGDNETFRPGDPSLRKELIAIATKYNWSAITTRDKILYGIDQIKNPYYKEVLRNILVV